MTFVYFLSRVESVQANCPGPSKIRKISSTTIESDISTVHHNSSDTDKYKILTLSQSFDHKHNFPQRQFGFKTDGKPHMRSFSARWLDDFGKDGLIYSVKEDAAYCKYCRLFPGGDRGMLVEKPFQKWKCAIRDFNAHFRGTQADKTRGARGNKLHLTAIVRATEFIKQVEGERLAIVNLMDDKSKAQTKKNREVIMSIGKTIHLLAKQNLPLRGHRDDSQHLDKEGNNPGNFQELLKFRCESGDTVLQLHFEEGHKNATYRSKTIQNQLINIISDQILEGIIAKVKTAKFFAVSADEATDKGLQTQLTMTLRYVDEQGMYFLYHTKCVVLRKN